jgi:type IV fimbrial biogenesis protein FimT
MRQLHTSRSQHQCGFTLVELMVTVAVAALLVGLAAPTFRDMSIRNRLSTYTSDLIATIGYTRSEAVRRGVPVSICRSDDQETCTGTWSDGWIIFADPNGDGDRDDDDETEALLKVYSVGAPNFAFGADDSFEDSITFRADGAATATGMFAICYDGHLIGSRAVVITPLRPRVATDTNDDRIPNRDDGENITSCDAPSGS